MNGVPPIAVVVLGAGRSGTSAITRALQAIGVDLGDDLRPGGGKNPTGFFEDQARRRHNIQWYASLGASFFSRAAACERSARKASLLDTLARHFEPWRRRHARLGRELRDTPYLLDLS